MCDTSLISLRIPRLLLEEIDAQAKREQRSRAKVIIMRLGGVSSTVEQRSSSPQVAGSIPAPRSISSSCPSCGALAGNHFKGCKGK